MSLEHTETRLSGSVQDGRADSAHKARRHRREAERAKERLLQLLAVDPRVQYRGPDVGAARHAQELGFDVHDLLCLRVSLKQRLFTLILVPGRVWYRQTTRKLLFEIKATMAAAGVKAVLVSEGQLKKQPRLHNATLICTCGKVELSASERMKIQLFVAETAGATITDCAALILSSHPDPFGAVLRLVSDRVIDVRRDRPIGPFSVVTPPPDCH